MNSKTEEGGLCILGGDISPESGIPPKIGFWRRVNGMDGTGWEMVRRREDYVLALYCVRGVALRCVGHDIMTLYDMIQQQP